MERIKEFIIDKERINKVIHSNLFLAIVTMLLFVSWLFSLEILSCVTIVGTIIISSIYSDDANILGALLFLVMISFPTLPYFNTIPIYLIIELISFFVGGGYLIYKKIKNKTFSFKLGPIGLSMIILPIMCLVCETVRHITPFNNNSEFILFGYMGVLFILMITIAYFMLYLCGVNNKDNYFSKVFYFANIMLLLEFLKVIITNDIDELLYYNFGWGSQNNLVIALEICMPFLAYIFQNNNKRYDCIVLMIINYIVIPYTACRGGLLTSMLLLPFLIYIALKNTNNKKPWIVLSLSCVVVAIIAYLSIPSLNLSFEQIFSEGLTDNGRQKAWDHALLIYNNNPIFGGGVSALFDLTLDKNVPHGSIYFAHNTFITLLSTCGVIGIISFIILLIEMINVIYNIKSNEKYVYIFFFWKNI